jgi:hypothetical protein
VSVEEPYNGFKSLDRDRIVHDHVEPVPPIRTSDELVFNPPGRDRLGHHHGLLVGHIRVRLALQKQRRRITISEVGRVPSAVIQHPGEVVKRQPTRILAPSVRYGVSEAWVRSCDEQASLSGLSSPARPRRCPSESVSLSTF